MNYTKTMLLAAVFSGATIGSSQVRLYGQSDVARWNFTSVIAGPYNTPAATTNYAAAFATELGMDNSYTLADGTTFSVANCDVLVTGGDPNPLSAGNTWRIRGSGSGGGNGWSLSAPQYTQGAEFDVSTVGFSNITFSFDWYCTAQGIADLQLQYSTNKNDPNSWMNWTGSYNGNQLTVKSGTNTLLIGGVKNYNTVGTNVNFNLVDLSKIPGVANNPNFGVRLVSAYDPVAQTYLGASGGTYNNSSGNWRFDQIAVQGRRFPLTHPGPPIFVAPQP